MQLTMVVGKPLCWHVVAVALRPVGRVAMGDGVAERRAAMIYICVLLLLGYERFPGLTKLIELSLNLSCLYIASLGVVF